MPSSAPSSSATVRAVRQLGLALAIVALASWAGSLVQSSGGRVQVMDVKLPTQNGQWVVADLFKPSSATAETPAPLVVVVPGFQRSKEALVAISIELSRRGIVVLAIDPYAQGASSVSLSSNSATTEGYGLFAVVDYVAGTSNLNYVDRTRIGATGHSAGGNAAIRGASQFGKQSRRTGQPSALHSVYVSGYVLTLTEAVLRDVRSNVGVSYALHDEGAYRNELKNGDMRRAPEALRVINGVLPKGAKPHEEVRIGEYYGDARERSLRVVHNERVLHPLQPYHGESTANQIEFFEKAFGLKFTLPSSDQIWPWKDFCGLVALVAALVSVVPLAALLLQVPWFRPLVKPVPPPSPRPRGVGRVLFWGVFLLGAGIAAVTYIPFSELSQTLFPAASNREATWFFPQRMNNAVMLWAALNGVVGLLLYAGTRAVARRLQGGALPPVSGVSVSAGELGRTAVLAALLYLAFNAILHAVHGVFHVDYRFLFMGARPIQPVVLVLLAMYAPVFLVFFLVNSLRVNTALRVDGDPEWRSLLVAGLANSLGLLLILGVQYGALVWTGQVFWTDGWLYVNLLFAVVPMMFVLPYFNRYFFRLTGTIYLGGMATCLIFIGILLTNTVCYLPL